MGFSILMPPRQMTPGVGMKCSHMHRPPLEFRGQSLWFSAIGAGGEGGQDRAENNDANGWGMLLGPSDYTHIHTYNL